MWKSNSIAAACPAASGTVRTCADPLVRRFLLGHRGSPSFNVYDHASVVAEPVDRRTAAVRHLVRSECGGGFCRYGSKTCLTHIGSCTRWQQQVGCGSVMHETSTPRTLLDSCT